MGAGFRLWSNGAATSSFKYGDTPSWSYPLGEFPDLVEPVPAPEPETPDETTDDTPAESKTDDKSDKVTTDTDKDEDDDMMLWIIIVVAALVLLIAAVFLWICCCCRKSNQTNVTWFGKDKGDGPPVTIGKRSAAGIEMQTSPRNQPTRD